MVNLQRQLLPFEQLWLARGSLIVLADESRPPCLQIAGTGTFIGSVNLGDTPELGLKPRNILDAGTGRCSFLVRLLLVRRDRSGRQRDRIIRLENPQVLRRSRRGSWRISGERGGK